MQRRGSEVGVAGRCLRGMSRECNVASPTVLPPSDMKQIMQQRKLVMTRSPSSSLRASQRAMLLGDHGWRRIACGARRLGQRATMMKTDFRDAADRH